MPSRADRTEKDTSNAPPVFKTKCGRVHVAVFEQPTSQGSMLSVTFKRTYRTESGEFKDAYSFALGDLEDLTRAFRDVREWAEQNREN